MRKITQAVSAFLFLFALWCFVYPYAAEANVCNVVSCHMYLISGAILTVNSVVVLLVSFSFTDKGSDKQNESYSNNRKELHVWRKAKFNFHNPDIGI